MAHYRTSAKGVRFAFVRDLWVKGAKRDFRGAWAQGDLRCLRCSSGLVRRASECGTFQGSRVLWRLARLDLKGVTFKVFGAVSDS